jgi:hypothetical protein
VCPSPADLPEAWFPAVPSAGELPSGSHSDDQVPPALLTLCEWWVGLSVEERSSLLEAAEWAEIDRKVDAAVLGKAT